MTRAPLRLRRAARRWLTRFAPRLAARRCDLDAHELGRLGEELAARELRSRGWRICGRRVDTTAGEVDLLAREPRAGSLVCVEVKTRSAASLPRLRGARPARSTTATGRHLGGAQLRRLLRAARRVGAGRVDLIEVLLVPGRPPDLTHIVDVGASGRRRRASG